MVGAWGSVQADWTLLFVLLIGWYLLIKTWERNGTLDRWNATRALGIHGTQDRGRKKQAHEEQVVEAPRDVSQAEREEALRRWRLLPCGREAQRERRTVRTHHEAAR